MRNHAYSYSGHGQLVTFDISTWDNFCRLTKINIGLISKSTSAAATNVNSVFQLSCPKHCSFEVFHDVDFYIICIKILCYFYSNI